MLWEATRGGQGRVQAEKMAGPGVHAFIGVYKWSSLGFPGQVRIGQFKIGNNGILVSLSGVLSKEGGAYGKGPVYHKDFWGNHIRN